MKYEYVKIDTIGKGIFTNKTKEHRKIIDDYAARGYRYVGWFPTKSSNILEGVIEEVDLIFEKDEEDNKDDVADLMKIIEDENPLKE